MVSSGSTMRLGWLLVLAALGACFLHCHAQEPTADADAVLGRACNVTADCFEREVCVGGSCTRCGAAPGDLCCSDRTCYSADTVCGGERCIRCGVHESPCCTELQDDGSTKGVCDANAQQPLRCNGVQCVICGELNAPCCESDEAEGGCTANPSEPTICVQGVCKQCGVRGAVCCHETFSGDFRPSTAPPLANGSATVAPDDSPYYCLGGDTPTLCSNRGVCELCGGPNEICCPAEVEADGEGKCTQGDGLNQRCIGGVCLSCGGKGQKCCQPGPLDNPDTFNPCPGGFGLDCVADLCTTCGGPNQKCCDGIVPCLKEGWKCDGSTCVSCGKSASDCCPPIAEEAQWLWPIFNIKSSVELTISDVLRGQLNESQVDLEPEEIPPIPTELYCLQDTELCVKTTTENGFSTRFTCETCGNNQQLCCEGDVCAEGHVCRGGRCQVCGFNNFPCCASEDGGPEDVCNDPTTDTTCIGSICTLCGGINQPCCENSACNSRDLFCQTLGSANDRTQCTECGGLGQICCAGNVCNDKGLGCNERGRCENCGAPGGSGVSFDCLDKECDDSTPAALLQARTDARDPANACTANVCRIARWEVVSETNCSAACGWGQKQVEVQCILHEYFPNGNGGDGLLSRRIIGSGLRDPDSVFAIFTSSCTPILNHCTEQEMPQLEGNDRINCWAGACPSYVLSNATSTGLCETSSGDVVCGGPGPLPGFVSAQLQCVDAVQGIPVAGTSSSTARGACTAQTALSTMVGGGTTAVVQGCTVDSCADQLEELITNNASVRTLVEVQSWQHSCSPESLRCGSQDVDSSSAALVLTRDFRCWSAVPDASGNFSVVQQTQCGSANATQALTELPLQTTCSPLECDVVLPVGHLSRTCSGTRCEENEPRQKTVSYSCRAPDQLSSQLRATQVTIDEIQRLLGDGTFDCSQDRLASQLQGQACTDAGCTRPCITPHGTDPCGAVEGAKCANISDPERYQVEGLVGPQVSLNGWRYNVLVDVQLDGTCQCPVAADGSQEYYGRHCDLNDRLCMNGRMRPTWASAVEAERCCASGLIDRTGECCARGQSLDRDQKCCKGEVDACGVCGGTGTQFDVLGNCCSDGAIPDALGRCCPAAQLDQCGVCGGTGVTCTPQVAMPFRVRSAAAVLTSEVRAQMPPYLCSRVNADDPARCSVEFAFPTATAYDPSNPEHVSLVQGTPSGNDSFIRSGEVMIATVSMAQVASTRVATLPLLQARLNGLTAGPGRLAALQPSAADAVFSVEAQCGNGICETGEAPPLWPRLDASDSVDAEFERAFNDSCIVDCPIAMQSCPTPTSVGNLQRTCGGNGVCNRVTGKCHCFLGYGGDDCGRCADGFGEYRSFHEALPKRVCAVVNPAAPPSPPSSSSSTDVKAVGIIVGAVVGGAVALLLLIIAVRWFFFRTPSTPRSATTQSDTASKKTSLEGHHYRTDSPGAHSAASSEFSSRAGGGGSFFGTLCCCLTPQRVGRPASTPQSGGRPSLAASDGPTGPLGSPVHQVVTYNATSSVAASPAAAAPAGVAASTPTAPALDDKPPSPTMQPPVSLKGSSTSQEDICLSVNPPFNTLHNGEA